MKTFVKNIGQFVNESSEKERDLRKKLQAIGIVPMIPEWLKNLEFDDSSGIEGVSIRVGKTDYLSVSIEVETFGEIYEEIVSLVPALLKFPSGTKIRATDENDHVLGLTFEWYFDLLGAGSFQVFGPSFDVETVDELLAQIEEFENEITDNTFNRQFKEPEPDDEEQPIISLSID